MGFPHRKFLECQTLCLGEPSSCSSDKHCDDCITPCYYPPPPPPPPPLNHTTNHNISTYLIISFSIAASVFILLCCYAIYVKFFSPSTTNNTSRRFRALFTRQQTQDHHDFVVNNNDDDHHHHHVVDHPIWETSAEYSKRTWKVGRELLKGISESLGLEVDYIDKTMNLDSGLQVLAANLYPPCPQPERAMGMPPHSDHGLLNLLMQNGVSGLQVLHNGKWINVSSTPNCFLVLVSDHLEIMSNGKYKSVLHRATVSNGATRMSLATVIAPSLDTVVEPASELLDNQRNPAAYVGMKHRDYMQLQKNNQLYGKSVLNKVKI